jgi:hypothetical protein
VNQIFGLLLCLVSCIVLWATPLFAASLVLAATEALLFGLGLARSMAGREPLRLLIAAGHVVTVLAGFLLFSGLAIIFS